VQARHPTVITLDVSNLKASRLPEIAFIADNGYVISGLDVKS